jgi:hypothetical protein
MVAHLLAFLEIDEHRTALGTGEEHPRLTLSVRLDRREMPPLHGGQR